MQIRKYTYETMMGSYCVISPLKHGTRWLNTTSPFSIRDVSLIRQGSIHDKEILSNHIYDNTPPFTSSKIKIQKYKRALQYPNTYFVYRDPLEAFKSAIITGLASKGVEDDSDKTKWNRSNLDILMTSNGHFCHFYWRLLKSTLEDCEDDSDIKLVELRDLSKFMAGKLLSTPEYKKEEYDMNGFYTTLTKEEVLKSCEEDYSELWNTFIEQINLEREALLFLVDKYGWKPNVII